MTVVDNVTARKVADECFALLLEYIAESEVEPPVKRQVCLLLHQQLGDMGKIDPPMVEPDLNQEFRRPKGIGRVDDDSIMPFGKWRNTRLGAVPDYYWRWFLSQDWCDEWPDLVEYANLVEG